MLLSILTILAFVKAAISTNNDDAQDAQSRSSPIRAAIRANFPDPAILYANGIWYAYASNSGAGVLGLNANASMSIINPSFGVANVQMATSSNFVNWKIVSATHDPLPSTGLWAVQPLSRSEYTGKHLHSPRHPGLTSAVWAPGIIQRLTDGRYVMYYTATSNETNPHPQHPQPHCIGAAISDSKSPTGPFRPIHTPLACPLDEGGAIDPGAYKDTDGTVYTVWKVDGNNVGHGGECGNTVEPIIPTPIMLQRMEPDGVTTVGQPVQILDRVHNEPLVEAPMLVRSPDAVYFLFFSSGCTRNPSYSVRYATSRTITGPYTRAKNALLQTGDWGLEAPGSVGVHIDGGGEYRMAFHARIRDGDQGEVRAMFTTKLRFDRDTVTVIRCDDSPKQE